MTWADRSAAIPSLRLNGTCASGADFTPPPAQDSGECAVLAAAGVVNGTVGTSLQVDHGRGNPEVFGSPPKFLTWIVGDDERSVEYAIVVTRLFGPDC